MGASDHLPIVEGVEGLELVGQGGFASVYRGHQPAFRRDVAVKVLQRSGLDDDDRRRFHRECQAMGALSNHPGIVTLYDAGFTPDERPYLVMPYVADGTLGDHIARVGPLPWQDAVALGVRLSGALETAHRSGVLHRDVKPANVLRSEYGDQLSDFGIARIQGGHETRSGVITASIAHAAPEILDGDAPSPQADIYALASTLFESMTGKPAFVRDTDEGILPLIRRVVSEPPPDLRSRRVPDAVATIIETAMAKDPAARYPSAAAFGRALAGAQAALGVPVERMAIPDTPGSNGGSDRTTSGRAGGGPPVDTGDDAADGVGGGGPPDDVVGGGAPVGGPGDDRPSDGADQTVGIAPPTETSPPAFDRTQISEPVPLLLTGEVEPSRPLRALGIFAVIAAVVVIIAGAIIITRAGEDAPVTTGPVGTAAPTVAPTVAPTTEPPVETAAPTTIEPAPPTTVDDDGPGTTVEPVDTSSRFGFVALDPGDPLDAVVRQGADEFGLDLATGTPGASPAEQMAELVGTGENTILAIATASNREPMVTAVTDAAAANPDVTFVLVGAAVSAPNVVSTEFAGNQGSFLAGVVAARTTATGRIGFLGGADVLATQRFEAGFVAGARHVTPAVQIDVRYLPGTGENYDNRDAAFATATDMYIAGADVVYHVATSGSGVFAAATERPNAWAIGSETDQALAAAPAVRDSILTSLVENYDGAVRAMLDAASRGALDPGVVLLGLADGGVSLSTTGGHIDDLAAEIAEVTDQLVRNEISAPNAVGRRALAPLGAICPPQGCQVGIVTAEVVGSELDITIEANWVLDTDAFHVHWFWSPRYQPNQVGNDSAERFGVTVGVWQLEDAYPVYRTRGNVSLDGRDGDSELCVTAADAGHNVIDPSLFDCLSFTN